MSVSTRALCVALLLTGIAGAPAAEAAPDDWRFLYADGALRDGTGALRSEISASISIDLPAARFSPDGIRLAVPSDRPCGEECSSGEGAIRVHRADGTSFRQGAIPNFSAQAVAWSPDGETVAAVGTWFTPEDTDIRIYTIPLDGTTPTQVYSDTRLLRVSPGSGLSWHPTDDVLAFIATEVYDEDGGFIRFENTDQVWTVPVTENGVPSRWTGRPACEGCSSFPEYRQPTWSPEGDRLAVIRREPDELTVFGPASVGYLPEGALDATALRNAAAEDQLAFSSDGGHLAYGVYDTSGDFYDETEVVDADTGALVTVVEDVIAPFTDWLPCPGGTCPVWEDVYVAPRPAVNVHGKARRKKVIVSGEMFRVPEVADLEVRLDRRVRAGARWRRVTTVDVRAVEGLFTRKFARPKAVQCRARAVYRDGTVTASDTATFRC